MRVFLKKFTSVLVGIALAASIVSPLAASAQFGDVQDDSAQDTEDAFVDGVVMCAAVALGLYAISQIPGFNVPTSDTGNTVKDIILDCVFWAFKNAIIQEITGSTVQWVQNGLNGNPAFAQNINSYLRTIADNVSSDFIVENAAFLCSPFRAEIELQLTLLYKQGSGRTPPPACSLGDVIDNVDRFLDGDFSAGGWSGWLNMTLNPSNNYFGSYLKSRSELNARISSATGEAEVKLQLGNGFFSKEVQTCYATTPSGTVVTTGPDDRIEGALDYYCDEPQIVTPGTQIKNSLEQTFELNLDNIAAADEFDEVFSLLAAYLISDILTGDKGLAGYDPSTITHTPPDVLIPNIPTGGGDTTEPGPPGPSMCFTSSGTFVPQRGGDIFARAHFPLPQNVSYDELLFEVDVKNTGLRPLEEQPPAPNGTRPWVYNIFYIPRTPGANDVFGYINVRGDEGPSNYTNKMIMQQGVIVPWPNKPSTVGSLSFPVGSTYTFSYRYNGTEREIDLVVRDTNTGEVKGRLQMPADVPLNVGNKHYSVELGFPLDSGNIYDTPSYGWEYSNMRAEFLSAGDEPESCSNVLVRGVTASGNSGSTSGGGGGRGQGPFNNDWEPSDTPIQDGQGGGGAPSGTGELPDFPDFPWCTKYPNAWGCDGNNTPNTPPPGDTGGGGPTPGDGGGNPGCDGDPNCSPPRI